MAEPCCSGRVRDRTSGCRQRAVDTPSRHAHPTRRWIRHQLPQGTRERVGSIASASLRTRLRISAADMSRYDGKSALSRGGYGPYPRSFPVTADRAWNALPSSVRSAPSSLLQFRRDLKTALHVSVTVLFTIVSSCMTDCNFSWANLGVTRVTSHPPPLARQHISRISLKQFIHF